ncbi:MAG: glycosyltransferase family 2 protein [Janthinobacterium lividum]
MSLADSAGYALFLGSLLLVLYTYVGYPLIAAAMARWQPRLWRQGSDVFSVTIIMPVHNAAEIIPAKMRHLLQLDPAVVRQILVISDGSTDGTVELLRTFQDSRLRVLELPQQVGKAAALNGGILQATCDLLLFVDVRPRLEEDALCQLISNFADPSVGCAAGELLVQSSSQHDATSNAVGGAYWRYEQAIRTAEATWDSPVGVYGGFYAVRRSLVQTFPAGLILDDMYQPLSIIRQGYRNVLDRAAVVVDTWPASKKGEFQRKVRTLAGNFQLVRMAPWLLGSGNRVRFQFVSHKLLRLLVPFALILMLVSSAVLASSHPGWEAMTLLQAVFWLLAASALRFRLPILHRVLGPASALLLLNAAAVAGLYRFLFTSGPLWKIWSPTSTSLVENQAALWGGPEPS